MSGSLKEEVKIVKILANRHRIRILQVLRSSRIHICVREIAESVGISQSLASHFLSYLSTCRVVHGIRVGKTICYSPGDNAFAKSVFRVMDALTT